MAKPAVIDIDHGYKAFMQAAERLKGRPSVKIGFFDDKKNDRLAGETTAHFEANRAQKFMEAFGGNEIPTNIEVAIWAELGTRTEPERSFMRSTFDENREKYRKLAEKLTRAIMESGGFGVGGGKMDEKRALAIIGEVVVADIRKKIASDMPPPNAASTLAAKYPKTHTLISSGQMAGAVTYDVDLDSGGAK